MHIVFKIIRVLNIYMLNISLYYFINNCLSFSIYIYENEYVDRLINEEWSLTVYTIWKQLLYICEKVHEICMPE